MKNTHNPTAIVIVSDATKLRTLGDHRELQDIAKAVIAEQIGVKLEDYRYIVANRGRCDYSTLKLIRDNGVRLFSNLRPSSFDEFAEYLSSGHCIVEGDLREVFVILDSRTIRHIRVRSGLIMGDEPSASEYEHTLAGART